MKRFEVDGFCEKNKIKCENFLGSLVVIDARRDDEIEKGSSKPRLALGWDDSAKEVFFYKFKNGSSGPVLNFKETKSFKINGVKDKKTFFEFIARGVNLYCKQHKCCYDAVPYERFVRVDETKKEIKNEAKNETQNEAKKEIKKETNSKIDTSKNDNITVKSPYDFNYKMVYYREKKSFALFEKDSKGTFEVLGAWNSSSINENNFTEFAKKIFEDCSKLYKDCDEYVIGPYIRIEISKQIEQMEQKALSGAFNDFQGRSQNHQNGGRQ